VHTAVRTLPEPVRATAEQPVIELAPSLKLTDPVGLVPVTVAVKVTLVPTVDGFVELASVVVLAAPPPYVTLIVSEVGVEPRTMTLIP
jgi:hypothetical protein